MGNGTLFKVSSSDNNYFDLIEKHIDHQYNMFQNVIKEQNGKLRNVIGDAYIITFDKIDCLINAINYINKYWNDASKTYGLNKMRLGCHKGSFFTYRSLFGGLEVNTCAVLESTGKGLIGNNEQNLRLITHVSKIIRDEALHLNKNLKGAVIVEISNRSPVAGMLNVNDVIIEIQKKPIQKIENLDNLIKKVKGQGQPLYLTIINNNNQRRYLGVKLK